MSFDKRKIEELLCVLDDLDHIFPGYRLERNNEELNMIGRGGFSSVYKMRCIEDSKKQYVLKVMGFEHHMQSSESFWDTVHLQCRLAEDSPYICRIISAREIRVILDEMGELLEVSDVTKEKWEDEGLYLQFVLMEKLEDIVQKDRFGNITFVRNVIDNEGAVLDFSMQIGQALLHAHNNGVLHRDVKLENVFWDENEKCYKLGDFGIAKYVVEGIAETVVYTDGYGAPEIEKRLCDNYNATADIYSLGITLYLLLNEFKFPGSDGYYVNMIQYNPEFIFPAPKNASEEMTRIIRKMCQFYHDERYQSMAEVLMDISALRDGVDDNTERDDLEYPDFATETYREDKPVASRVSNQPRKSELTGRAKRKEEERIEKELFKKVNKRCFWGFTVLLLLLSFGLQLDISVVKESLFWILPIVVLIEALFLKINEFHIVGGIIAIGMCAYSCYVIGLNMSQILLLIVVLIGLPSITAAGAVATLLWGIINVLDKMDYVSWVSDYDLSWVLLIIVLISLNHYFIKMAEFENLINKNIIVHIWILDKIFLLIPLVGVIWTILNSFGIVIMPEVIQRMHLVRTGIGSLIAYTCYTLYEDYKKRTIEEENSNEK